MGEQGGGRPTLGWNYGIEVEEALTKKTFHLTHKENIEKTKELLRKPGKLSLPFWIQGNCVPQNIPLRGHRDSAKMIQNWEKVNLLILEILYYYVMDPREEIENHVQQASWMPHVLLFSFRIFLLFWWYFKANWNN